VSDVADLLAGGRPRCPIHNRILIWTDRCRLCWPDNGEWEMANRPWGAAEVEELTDEQAESFDRCLTRYHAEHCALNN
jgi:hypothetical protein